LNETLFDLGRFLDDSLRLMRGQAQAAGIALELSPVPPVAVRGDERRLRQCVLNLLANAIKFASRGRVTVSASACDSSLDLWVADTGCGIPEDQMERVFQPFHKVENALNRTSNGTGLGLPLSRKLVERHGGTLDLESVLGSGTIAILCLPDRVERIDSLRTADA
jgi:signal transduction histidine kinase